MTTTSDDVRSGKIATGIDASEGVEALDRLATAIIDAGEDDGLFDVIDAAQAIGNLLPSDDSRTAWYLLLDLCPVHGCDIDICTDDGDDTCSRQRIDGAPAEPINTVRVFADGREFAMVLNPPNCDSMRHWHDFPHADASPGQPSHHHHTDRCANMPRQATLRPTVLVEEDPTNVVSGHDGGHAT